MHAIIACAPVQGALLRLHPPAPTCRLSFDEFCTALRLAAFRKQQPLEQVGAAAAGAHFSSGFSSRSRGGCTCLAAVAWAQFGFPHSEQLAGHWCVCKHRMPVLKPGKQVGERAVRCGHRRRHPAQGHTRTHPVFANARRWCAVWWPLLAPP